ncbi:MAG TPA: NAD(P)-dependent alcohol dehydrogenase, partial [Micromonosporaceae bacterium]|nr:NAD(P)-dependent alcohol dehydrogenase [Micromonosporaceae bacterium]
MRAIVQDRYGSADVLELGELAVPAPVAGEVRVRVRAASVNAADWHIMRGDPYVARFAAPAVFGATGPKRKVRGRDFAGVVDAVGAGVTRLRPGDQVYGYAGEGEGTFAEFVCVPEDLVDVKPANLTFEQAAAVPLAAGTALVGLRDVARLRPGQSILINGASGGVGTFAVQLAVAFGATVTGVCSTRNVDLVRSLGAAEVVDYRERDFARAGREYDVILDLVGNRSLTDLRRTLTPDGTLVLAGGGVSDGGSLIGPMALIIRGWMVSRFVRHRLEQFTLKPGRDHLVTLRELAEAGKFVPVVDRTFPLGEAAAAVRYVEV